MKTAIQKNVMRRVYYSYAVSVALQPMLWQGFLLGACIALFGRLTHVASIAHNFAATRVENIPSYLWSSFVNAYTGGEVLTVLVVLFMFGLSVSCVMRALPLLLSGMHLKAA